MTGRADSDLDVRVVGSPAVAGEVAALLASWGVSVRGPYPRRDEPGRVSYYARLAPGAVLSGPALPGRRELGGDQSPGSR